MSRRLRPIPMKPSLLTLKGISKRQIIEHFEVLYKEYVNKVNEIVEKLPGASREEANSTYSEIRELKLEETFARNGVILHELYFLNLGGVNEHPDPLVISEITRAFGSYEYWKEDFRATAMAARGWAILAFDYRDRTLHNYLLDAHNIGVITYSVPLLILDVYEHAYFIDYSTRRKAYIDAFMENIDWRTVRKRFQGLMEAGTGSLTVAEMDME